MGADEKHSKKVFLLEKNVFGYYGTISLLNDWSFAV